MYGQGLVNGEGVASAFLMASWSDFCSVISLKRQFYPFWKRNFCRVIDSCKITTPTDFIKSHEVYWWRTPAESPDLNPIENMWHELKEFNWREVKPQLKDELVACIIRFWDKYPLLCLVTCSLACMPG